MRDLGFFFSFLSFLNILIFQSNSFAEHQDKIIPSTSTLFHPLSAGEKFRVLNTGLCSGRWRGMSPRAIQDIPIASSEGARRARGAGRTRGAPPAGQAAINPS